MIFLWIAGIVVVLAATTLSIALCTGSDADDLLPLTKHDELARDRNKKVEKERMRNVTVVSEGGSSTVKNAIAQRNLVSREDVLRLARQYLAHTNYSNPELLGEIGTRSSKYYFTVQDQHKVPHIMTLISVGEQSLEILKGDKNKAAIQSIIYGVRNPFVMVTDHNEFKREKGFYMTIRQINDKGSLRDIIHKSRPFKPAKEKYVLRNFDKIRDDKIALYGKQILEGLLYLKSQGIPFYNVHAGNILIFINSSNNHSARVTDYESDLLDLEPKFVKTMKGDSSKVLPEVIGFAGILYEIAAGYELDSYELDDMPHEDFSKEVKALLRSVFKAETPLTLEALADHPFFRNVKLYSDWDGEPIQKTTESSRVLARISDNALAKVTGSKVPASKSNRRTATRAAAPAPAAPAVTTTAAPAPAAPVAPPPPVAAAPPPPPPPSSNAPPPPPPPSLPSSDNSRKSLLGSIESFKSGNLKKVKTKDKSSPLLSKK